MEDIFSLNTTEELPLPTISKDDYIMQSREVFKHIDKEYSKCWNSQVVTDDESEIAPCENCKGEGFFTVNGIMTDCFQDREQGQCYKRTFNQERFIEFMEQEYIFSGFDGLVFTEII
jgi:hypothetical protein